MKISDKRKAFLAQTYQHKFHSKEHCQACIDNISSHIQNPQYIQWVLLQTIKNPTIDLDVISSNLIIFDKIKNFLPVSDINQYKTISDLYEVTKDSSSLDTVSRKQQKKQIKKDGTKLIFETPRFKVIQLLTIEAVLLYDAHTMWCTNANNNFFDFYKSSDDIYLILVENRKFQFHFASEELRNEQDIQITKEEIDLLSKYEEYTLFLNLMINKYYKL
jgi:hypothetical protein